MSDEMDPSFVAAAGRKAKKKEEQEPEMVAPTYQFHVSVTDRRGKTWEGLFEGKVPTVGDQIRIGQMKAVYLPNGSASDPNALLLAEMISYTHVCLTAKPKWWAPHEFYDEAPLIEVYGRCRAFEDRFLGRTQDQGRDAHGSSDEGSDEGAAEARDLGDLDGDIQRSSKRREVLTPHRP